MESTLIVYQLLLGFPVPAGVAPQLVLDGSDPEHPYTLTYHLTGDQLSLPDLLAAGRAVLLSGCAPPGAEDVPARPPLELMIS